MTGKKYREGSYKGVMPPKGYFDVRRSGGNRKNMKIVHLGKR
jgi:hypothetical protein